MSAPKHEIARCTSKESRAVARDFTNLHHSYITFADRPSRKMYWLLYEYGNLVGVFGLVSAFARPKAVSAWMGINNIAFNELGNNSLYCLAGQEDRNAGSKFLAMLRRDAKKWWYERYSDELKAIQTFILPPRIGAVYKADNWQIIGQTTGGSTMTTRALYGEDIAKHPEAERRVFRSGEVKYLLRVFRPTEQKLMFVKLLKPIQRPIRQKAA